MITVPGFAGKQVAVLGLARSGRAAAAALMTGGATQVAMAAQPAPSTA